MTTQLQIVLLSYGTQGTLLKKDVLDMQGVFKGKGDFYGLSFQVEQEFKSECIWMLP